jgi:hypothetical protein
MYDQHAKFYEFRILLDGGAFHPAPLHMRLNLEKNMSNISPNTKTSVDRVSLSVMHHKYVSILRVLILAGFFFKM